MREEGGGGMWISRISSAGRRETYVSPPLDTDVSAAAADDDDDNYVVLLFSSYVSWESQVWVEEESRRRSSK